MHLAQPSSGCRYSDEDPQPGSLVEPICGWLPCGWLPAPEQRRFPSNCCQWRAQTRNLHENVASSGLLSDRFPL